MRKKTHSEEIERQIESAVWELFRDSSSVARVAREVSKRLNLKPELSRESVYKYIRQAVSAGRLRYVPGRQDILATMIRNKFFLENVDVDVVETSTLGDVAYRTAERLVYLIEDRVRNREQREVHVGFSGGYTARLVVQALADLLSNPRVELPKTIVFHALVAGFDTKTPGSDPTSFFTYLDDPRIDVEVRFELLHAPPMLPPESIGDIKRAPWINRAVKAVRDLDLVVTSAADFRHEHSMLYKFYEMYSPETVEMLKEDRCIGEMLWLPIGPDGPLRVSKYPYRAVTLVELDELGAFIRRGLRVLLAVGPCGHLGCNYLKTGVLQAVMRMDIPLVSHLVVDSRTASAMAGGVREADVEEHQ